MTSSSTKSNSVGFPKGTRIVTKDGLKPIEEIQVGDYVLSAPEDCSGEPEYRQVVNICKYSDKRIWRLAYCILEEKPYQEYLLSSTTNNQFWKDGAGWRRADCLKSGDKLRFKNGTHAKVTDSKPVYKTDMAGIGWMPQSDLALNEAQGSVFDYANYQIFEDKEKKYRYILPEVYESADPFLKVDVFNLEVEDFTTYFVTYDGIWVHQHNG